MGIIWEESLGAFLLVTVFLGGGAAYMTGRAVALTWRQTPQFVVFLFLLACAVRFIHYALFGGGILSVQFFLVDLAVLLAIAGIGFQLTRAGQMAGQYSWLYDRAGPLAWRPRGGGEPAPGP